MLFPKNAHQMNRQNQKQEIHAMEWTRWLLFKTNWY